MLHADPQEANRALQLITAEWDKPAAAFDTESVGNYFLEKVPADKSVSGTFQSTFRTGYLAHAPMEPHAAVAELKDGKLTAWVGTQGPFQIRSQIAQALGLDESKVRVITPFVGGGFGGKSRAQQAIEASKLAQITGKPVMVAWTRGEEFFYDTFGPASVVKVASSMDGNGKITQWDHTSWANGTRSAADQHST